MSELGAFLADHDLEEIQDVLHAAGMERIEDLDRMGVDDLIALGAETHLAEALIIALSRASTYVRLGSSGPSLWYSLP